MYGKDLLSFAFFGQPVTPDGRCHVKCLPLPMLPHQHTLFTPQVHVTMRMSVPREILLLHNARAGRRQVLVF